MICIDEELQNKTVFDFVLTPHKTIMLANGTEIQDPIYVVKSSGRGFLVAAEKKT